MSSDKELGTLVVVVLKAKNLNDKYFWKQDVFAQVGLNGDTKDTKVDVKGGQHPMWDEEIRIPVMKTTGDKFRKLAVSCWAKEPRKEVNIGQGFVDLTETLKTGEFDDWVSLESDGVARGEIYLEMTFFTNAPAPVGLAASKANNLQRRPSKLSPAERLARPQYTAPLNPHHQQEHPQHGQPATGYLHPSPPHSRTPSASPSRNGRESPLPPLPEQQGSPGPPVPSTLTPGRPRTHSSHGPPQHVPSVLRPRNPKSSPTPITRPVSEYTGVVPPQGHGYASASPPRGYTPVVPPPDTVYDDTPAYGARPPLESWSSGSNDSPGGFSFPVPSIPGAREPTVEYSNPTPSPPGGYVSPPPRPDQGRDRHESTSSFQPLPPQFQPQQPPQFQPPPPQSQFQPQQPPQFQPHPPQFQQPPPPASSSFAPPVPPHRNSNNDLPDPYLLARYQSPLPLPPGSQAAPAKTQHAAPAPAPAPPPKSQPTPASQSNPDNARLQALRQVEEGAAQRRAQEEKDRELARKLDRELGASPPKSAPEPAPQDNARLRALREAEEAAAKRRAQEEKDRELARQLDRELNLGEAADRGADMPGTW